MAAVAVAELRPRKVWMASEPDDLGAYLAWEMSRRRWNPNAIEQAGGPTRQYVGKILGDHRSPEERADAEIDWPGPIILRRLASILANGDSDPTAARRIYVRMMTLAGYLPAELDPAEHQRRIEETTASLERRAKLIDQAEEILRALRENGETTGQSGGSSL